MAIGRVKWFNNNRGFGFIESAEGLEIFVHYSSIEANGYKSLAEGDRVKFDVYEGTKGPQAKNVTAIHQ